MKIPIDVWQQRTCCPHKHRDASSVLVCIHESFGKLSDRRCRQEHCPFKRVVTKTLKNKFKRRTKK